MIEFIVLVLNYYIELLIFDYNELVISSSSSNSNSSSSSTTQYNRFIYNNTSTNTSNNTSNNTRLDNTNSNTTNTFPNSIKMDKATIKKLTVHLQSNRPQQRSICDQYIETYNNIIEYIRTFDYYELKRLSSYFLDKAKIDISFSFEDILMVMTFFVLFANEIKTISGPKAVDEGFTIATSICLFFFILGTINLINIITTTIIFNTTSHIDYYYYY